MDWMKKASFFLDLAKKYKYVILIIIIGITLMAIPTQKENADEPSNQEIPENMQENFTQELTKLLSEIKGVGKVKVLLTYKTGEEVIYQTDDRLSSDGTTLDTVIVTDDERNQNGLIKQVRPAEYLGAIILCQGADNASVRLAVIEAVSKITGLGSDCVCVLKMK